MEFKHETTVDFVSAVPEGCAQVSGTSNDKSVHSPPRGAMTTCARQDLARILGPLPDHCHYTVWGHFLRKVSLSHPPEKKSQRNDNAVACSLCTVQALLPLRSEEPFQSQVCWKSVAWCFPLTACMQEAAGSNYSVNSTHWNHPVVKSW